MLLPWQVEFALSTSNTIIQSSDFLISSIRFSLAVGSLCNQNVREVIRCRFTTCRQRFTLRRRQVEVQPRRRRRRQGLRPRRKRFGCLSRDLDESDPLLPPGQPLLARSQHLLLPGGQGPRQGVLGLPPGGGGGRRPRARGQVVGARPVPHPAHSVRGMHRFSHGRLRFIVFPFLDVAPIPFPSHFRINKYH